MTPHELLCGGAGIAFLVTCGVASAVERHQKHKYGAQDLDPFDKSKTVDYPPKEWAEKNILPKYSTPAQRGRVYDGWLTNAVLAWGEFTGPQRFANGLLTGAGLFGYMEIANLLLQNESPIKDLPVEGHVLIGVALLIFGVGVMFRRPIPDGLTREAQESRVYVDKVYLDENLED